jgi:lysophospholipase L1-like esterase
MIPRHRSGRTTRRIASLLVLVGLGTPVSMSCGGSREPIVRKSSSHGGVAGGSAVAGNKSCSDDGGSAGDLSMAYSGTTGELIEITPAWDWNGVIGTGQSLAVGTDPITSTTQPYNNLMLSIGNVAVPPWDPAVAGLSMVPLIERKNQTSYPAPYPKNRWGETPHSAMANQLTAMVRYFSGNDFVSVHSIVGESGQGIEALKKNTGDSTETTGRAYAATLFEVAAITRLAQEAGKAYGVSAVVMTHGETDSGSTTYEDELIQLMKDYNADLSAITGQTGQIPMLLSQQFAYPSGAGQRPTANQIQWRLGVEHAGAFVCTGPKYQYPGHPKGDGVHLSSTGYQMLGEKTAQVYYERIILGRDWQPLQPLSASRGGRVITVNFHVPVAPLTWDECLPAPTTDWPNGKGFEVRSGNTSIGIDSVAIDGDSVKITCSSDLPSSVVVVSYAMTAGTSQMPVASKAVRWGLLRDSDPYVGATTKTRQPNYAVAFDLPVQ